MWNIRSHARRFPVHTGTLTPSIAHPNRFLNHLKRFSAGFLTFRGGKMEKRTLWGENSPVCCADSPLWDGALGMAGKFAGKSQSLRVRLLPLGGAVAQRLRGFQSAEHKKSFSEATWIFCTEPNSFGVTRGEQPLVRASRASKVAGAFLVLFWHAKENIPGGDAFCKRHQTLNTRPLSVREASPVS